MSSPTVSIILPTYNRAALLPRSIESVLAQTYTDFELIIVDDNSTDDSPAVFDRYRDDPRVRILVNETNLGGGGARNRGIAEATGRYIAFQDSDDYWMPHKIARQVQALEANPDCGLVYCGALYYGELSSYYLPEKRFAHFEGDMVSETLKGNPATPQVLMVQRDILTRTTGFETSYVQYEDWDLVIQIAALTRFTFIDEPMVVVYKTPGSLSSNPENDALYRDALITKHAALFAQSPRSLARHHYVIARIRQKLGDYGAAMAHYRQSFQLAPNPKAPLFYALSAAQRLLRKDRKHPKTR